MRKLWNTFEQFIRFVIIDRESDPPLFFFKISCLFFLIIFPLGESSWPFVDGIFILFGIRLWFSFIYFNIFSLLKIEAFHERLISCRNLSRSFSINTVCIISDSNEKTAKQYAQIKAISFLPSRNICGGGNYFWEFVGRIKLFELNEFGKLFRALSIVVEFEKAQLCWSDGCADEFVNIALVLWVEV